MISASLQNRGFVRDLDQGGMAGRRALKTKQEKDHGPFDRLAVPGNRPRRPVVLFQ
jgi:hypothetical protein